jgi:hypothetical protein
MVHDLCEQRDRRRKQYGDNNAERDEAVYKIAATLAFWPMSASSAQRFGDGVGVVGGCPIPGVALAATTANPASEAYQSIG